MQLWCFGALRDSKLVAYTTMEFVSVFFSWNACQRNKKTIFLHFLTKSCFPIRQVLNISMQNTRFYIKFPLTILLTIKRNRFICNKTLAKLEILNVLQFFLYNSYCNEGIAYHIQLYCISKFCLTLNFYMFEF